MNHDQARDVVREAAQHVVPGADFTGLAPGANLRDAFEMDSLDFLEFVEELARLSGRELTENDYPSLVTWEDCARLLESREPAAHGTRSR
ncbi:phosphopantetheine-binding protein [Streptomyces sp. NPDC006296]|uniref:phosphopantetheine-binding protein n=1 Tax=Streptomyces sp. NPDC006296 TaxID=3156746 RepID=UPI0033ACDDB9